MRTTVTLDDELYRRAKVKAAEEGTTFSALVAEALEGRVCDEVPFQFTVSREGGGLRPGLSLERMSELLDFLDFPDESDDVRP